MNLQYQRGWVQNEPGLLGRLDAECKEWERQLRDMQRNIEELYKEVKARREETETGSDGKTDPWLPASGQRSKGSSKHFSRSNDHRYSPDQQSCVNDDSRHHYTNGHCDSANHMTNSSRDRAVCQGYSANNLLSQRSNGWNSSHGYDDQINCNSDGSISHADHNGDAGRESAMRELEDILNFCLGQTVDCTNSPATLHSPNSSVSKLHGNQSTTTYDRKKSGPLTATPDGLTQMSDHFNRCQDAMWKKSRDKRDKACSVKAGEGREEAENIKNKAFYTGYEWCENSRDPIKVDHRFRACPTNADGPPIPPRTTSWYRNSLTTADPEFPASIPERKCVSPSVLRKFGAMLKENEGKTLMDSGLVTTVVSASAKRMSSTPGKFHTNKLPSLLPVSKCTSHNRAEREQLHPAERDFVGKTCSGSTFGTPSSSCSDWESPPKHSSSQFLAQNMRCHDDIITLINMLELEQQSSSSPKVRSSNRAQVVLQETILPSSMPITRPFSRPTHPVKRRPPSRWAARIPSITATGTPAEIRTSCSFSSQMETVIM